MAVALDHVALPRLREGSPYEILRPLLELARYLNLYLKFSSETIYAAGLNQATVQQQPRLLSDNGPS